MLQMREKRFEELNKEFLLTMQEKISTFNLFEKLFVATSWQGDEFVQM